jgi:hypothetical protein
MTPPHALPQVRWYWYFGLYSTPQTSQVRRMRSFAALYLHAWVQNRWSTLFGSNGAAQSSQVDATDNLRGAETPYLRPLFAFPGFDQGPDPPRCQSIGIPLCGVWRLAGNLSAAPGLQ